MRIDAPAIPLQPRSPNDAAEIDRVSRQMEGLFAQMMIKQMRDTTLGDSMFPGAAGQFRDLHDEQIAKSLTSGRGLGLADMISKQLHQQAGTTPPGDKGALPLSLAKAGTAPMLPLDTYTRPMASKALTREPEIRPLALASANGDVRANALPIDTKAAASARLVPTPEAYVPASVAKSSAAAEAARAAGPSNARIEAFVAKVWPQAEKVGRELGVDPRAIVAQAALETGWGRSTIRGDVGQTGTANNYFGIKATGGWRGASVSTDTQEFAQGAFRTERAAFRAYDGVEQSFADYAALLKKNPRYAAALGAGSDIRGFAQALQRGGYATDPSYARKIESIATGPTLERALARLDINDARGPAQPAAARSMLAAGGIGVF
jgi:flagellar protein FlgJ